MRQDLLAARLKVNHAGKWNHPFVLEEESTVNEVNFGPCVNISTPECFHMIDLPLQGVGKSDCSLAKLPDEFQDEAEKKRERVKLWETLEGDLHPSQMVELQNVSRWTKILLYLEKISSVSSALMSWIDET